MEKEQVRKRSLIKKYFSDELYIELLKVTFIPNSSNDEKVQIIKKLLTDYNVPFTGLGAGTNRMGILIDGYAVKIALDKDGQVDNRREMKYSKVLQPYVIKVYECTPNGLIAFTEFVEYFTLDDFHKNQSEMEEILSIISENYLIGDVGLTTKNYANWGRRRDDSICILDFAYIYDVSYNTFKCGCEDETLLRYDNRYVNLVCPTCGRKYSFGEIRRRISRTQQENEIGDIRSIGYNIHNDNELVDIIPDFEPEKEEQNKKKKLSPEKEFLKKLKEERREAEVMSKKFNDIDYISPEEQTRNMEELDKLIFGDRSKPSKVTDVAKISKKNISHSIDSQINNLIGGNKSNKKKSPESVLDLIMDQEREIEKKNNKETDAMIASLDDQVFDVNSDDDYEDVDETEDEVCNTEDNISDDAEESDASAVETEETEDISTETESEYEEVVDANPDDYEEVDEDDIEDDDVFYDLWCRAFKIIVPDNLSRLVINDGVAPTSYSMVYGNDPEYKPETIVIGTYDADDCVDRYEQLLDFIISFKHPTAVFTENDFDEIFAGVTDYDDSMFRFYRVNGYVFAYLVDMESVKDFGDYLSSLNYNENQILGTMVGISYAVSNLNNAFFCDNYEYVTNFYNSDFNMANYFVDCFMRDENLEKDDSQTESYPATIDVEDLQNLVRTLIKSMTGEDIDDEDDEDEDDEDLFGDDDETDEPDEIADVDDSNEEDIADDLLSDNMESVEEPEEHKIIVDVVRKHDN